MLDIKDHYRVLQISTAATPEEVETAYKKLIRIYHPDINKSPNATEKMQELNEARAILRDQERRRSYDLERATMLSDKSFLDGLLGTPATANNSFNTVAIRPSAEFDTVRIAHGAEIPVFSAMAFYVSLYIHHYYGRDGRLCAFLYYQNETPVRAAGENPYTTPNGFLTVQDTFSVEVVHGYGKNLALFLPYNQFPRGHHSYYALMQITTDEGETLASTKTEVFSIARPAQ
jgi:curved DNA-binding protein CbpA